MEGLRTHRFWLARARLVVAFGLFGSVASSFGTMWKGCERTVFGCLFSGLCFACLGHEACCRSRLSEASHRGILLGVGSNPAAVRAFRMGSFTAPWHVCGRFGLGTTFGSSTAFGVAVYWFRTQPRSEGAGHKKCFMDSKGDGKHFFWLVFLACLSSACSGVWPFRIRCPRASFLCLCRFYRLLICYGPLPVFFFTASKLQFRHRVEGLRTHRFWLARARLVVAFGLFGSVASSFGTMWKGCERTVFGCLFSGLCFACLGHEACCRSRLSEASHRGILLGVGSNPAAVRAFRMGSFTAPWHVCGRFGLGTTFGSSTLIFQED